ncbi:MAG: copper resistance protein CopA [Robiginitomaculum sp.]|nr:MAG: copper resistance protein CopA [Robiginitomaculum sp.]
MRGAEMVTRRQILGSVTAGATLVALEGLLPAWARSGPGFWPPADPRTGAHEFDLNLARTPIMVDGKQGSAVTMNGSVPGPIMRFKEGETVTIRVHNNLDESSSVHWHGILLDYRMDGVPGVSFPGIPAGETFTYHYPLKQSGTYWYHSHSGLQEQLGMYGPIIIDPIQADPVAYDREHVIVLSDWMFENPYRVLAKLKKQSDYLNYQKRTLGTFFSDVKENGFSATWKDRLMWGDMRMSPSDIADVTGHIYTYLMNGHGPQDNWTGLFKPGERVRLRIINAATMSYFNFRIPGLRMTVVQADGQNIEPVTIDEFQIGVAETFDVIVTPEDDRAYTIFAESMDRSSYVRGTLAPRLGMSAEVPALRGPPLRSMFDMGMDMGGMDMGAAKKPAMDMGGVDHSKMDHSKMGDMDMGGMDMGSAKKPAMKMDHSKMGGMEMGDMDMGGMDMGAAKKPAMKMGDMDMGSAGPIVARHGPDHHGPGAISVAEVQRNRLGEPGTGLKDVGHRVLVYNDLKALEPYNQRAPDREVELHLTGNMERYMWSFDGKKFSEVNSPVRFNLGERLRLILVNDTMMDHPIHLHGLWMELENGHGEYLPRKHTISVKPGERVSALINVDAGGRWAFHCHLLFHMDMGMFRVVEVSPYEGEIL